MAVKVSSSFAALRYLLFGFKVSLLGSKVGLMNRVKGLKKNRNGESGLVCPLRRPVVRDRRRGGACAILKARRVPFGTTVGESLCWLVGPHPLIPGGRGVLGAARDQFSRQPFPGRLVVPPRGSGKERAFRGPAASGPGPGPAPSSRGLFAFLTTWGLKGRWKTLGIWR